MLFEQLWSNPLLWIGLFIIALVITRRRYVWWIIAILVTAWYLGNDFGIVWNNVINFPINLIDNVSNFFGSLYDPNEGLLENIFYSDYTWIILFIILMLATRGQGVLLIIGTLFVLWLLGNLVILSLGIEVFFAVALISVVIAMFFFRNRNVPSSSESREEN